MIRKAFRSWFTKIADRGIYVGNTGAQERMDLILADMMDDGFELSWTEITDDGTVMIIGEGDEYSLRYTRKYIPVTTDHLDNFLAEYQQLCRKYRVAVQGGGTPPFMWITLLSEKDGTFNPEETDNWLESHVEQLKNSGVYRDIAEREDKDEV